MLTLILLRHAKAVASSSDDFARDLTAEGRAAAQRAGASFLQSDLVPDLAIVSPSARTRQTFEALQAACGTPIASRFSQTLYNATERQIRDDVRDLAGRAIRVMVVGHNPGIMEAALALASRDAGANLAKLRERFPPCAYAVLTFKAVAWADVATGCGRLDLFTVPEDLAARE